MQKYIMLLGVFIPSFLTCMDQQTVKVTTKDVRGNAHIQHSSINALKQIGRLRNLSKDQMQIEFTPEELPHEAWILLAPLLEKYASYFYESDTTKAREIKSSIETSFTTMPFGDLIALCTKIQVNGISSLSDLSQQAARTAALSPAGFHAFATHKNPEQFFDVLPHFVKKNLVQKFIGSLQPYARRKGFRDTNAYFKTVQENVSSLVISHDNAHIAVAGSSDISSTVALYRTDQLGQGTVSTETEPIYQVAFHPEKPLLASACLDGTVKLWDISESREYEYTNDGTNRLKNRTPIQIIKTDKPISVSFKKNAALIAIGLHNGIIQLYDIAETASPITLTGHAKGILALYFDDNGNLASASGDATARVWDLNTKKECVTFSGHEEPVTCVSLLPYGHGLYLTGSEDASIRLWDKQKNRAVFPLAPAPRAPINSVAGTNDGINIIATNANGVYLWDIRMIHRVDTISAQECSAGALSPDGSHYAWNNSPQNSGSSIWLNRLQTKSHDIPTAIKFAQFKECMPASMALMIAYAAKHRRTQDLTPYAHLKTIEQQYSPEARHCVLPLLAAYYENN